MSKEEFIELIKLRGCYQDKNGEWNCDISLNISNLNLVSIPVKFNIIINC